MNTAALTPNPGTGPIANAWVPRFDGGEAGLMAVLPAALMIYSAVLPPEIRISIAEQTFYPTRLASLALLPWLITQAVRHPVRYIWVEFVFFGAVFWMVFAFMAYYEPLQGLLRGGALAYDTVVPYLVARYSIRSANDFRRLLILIAPVLLLAGLTLMLEATLRTPIIRPMAASVFGALPAYENGVAVGIGQIFIDSRMGLLRAAGPFSHPIMAGMFLTSFLAIYAMSGIRSWPRVIGVASAFFAVFTVSSSAFLALIMALGLMAIDMVQRMLRFLSWHMIWPFCILSLLAAHVYSESGLVGVLVRYTLNPQTGHFRRLIWEYGTASVARNPWIGIGFTDYERLSWMTPSVDSHWLLLAIRFGIIPPLVIFAFSLAALWLVTTSSVRVSAADKRLHTGIAISLFIMVLLGFTVSFTGGVLLWFQMVLAVSIALYLRSTEMRPVAPQILMTAGMHTRREILPAVERRAYRDRSRGALRDPLASPEA